VLKITPIRNGNSSRLQLCGDLREEYLREIERVLDEERVAFSRVSLDLGNVQFVDRRAMLFLLEAGGRNIDVENCPSYVKRWIEQEGL
jgi:hypothetical protein